MSYLKRLTLIGKVSNLSAPVAHYFDEGQVSPADFMDRVRPSAVRRVVRSQVGNRKISFYQLVPPNTGVPTNGAVVDHSENLPLSIANIRAPHGDSLLHWTDYAHRGGEIFKTLLENLDVLVRYTHGNFTTAVTYLAYQCVFNAMQELGSKWTLEDDQLADCILALLTATTREEIDARMRQLKNYLDGAESDVMKANAELITASLSSLRGALHSDVESEQVQTALKALDWSERRFRLYKPFGEWKNQREDFLQAFKEYREARIWFDGFIRNVPEHAYLMMYLFSKYGTLRNNSDANRPLAVAILKCAIEDQKNRQFGLPSGLSASDVGRSIRRGVDAVVMDGLNDDQRRRANSVLEGVTFYIDGATIPREILERDVYIAGAVKDFEATVSRVLDDSVMAQARDAVGQLKSFFNAARKIASSGDARSKQIEDLRALVNERLDELARSAGGNASFLAGILRNCKDPLSQLAEGSKQNIYAELVQVISKGIGDQSIGALKADDAGTARFAQAVRQYELHIGARIDSSMSRELGNVGVSVTADVSRMTPTSEKATSTDPRIERIRERRRKRGMAEAARLKRTTRETYTVAKFSHVIPADQSVTFQGKSGGSFELRRDQNNTVEVRAKPAEMPKSQAVDRAGLATTAFCKDLSSEGLIVRGADGLRVGKYQRSKQEVELTYESGETAKPDDNLVSGTVVAGEKFTLSKLKFEISGQELRALTEAKDGKLVLKDVTSEFGRQIQQFAESEAETKRCTRHLASEERVVEVRCNANVVELQLPVDDLHDNDRLVFEYNLNLKFAELKDRDYVQRTVAREFKTPADPRVRDLPTEEMGNLATGVLHDLSAIAAQFENDEEPEQVNDFWHKTVRSRVFRENVLAAPVGTIPFEKVDLGSTFEAIAQCIRNLGNRELGDDLYKPKEIVDKLLLADLDLSTCFPVSDADDILDVIGAYAIVCKEDQKLTPYRQELSNVLTAFEQLSSDRDCSVTFINSSLAEYVDAIPNDGRQTDDLFFATHPTAYVHVLNCGVAGFADTGAKLEQLSEAFDRVTQSDSRCEFRYPLVTMTGADPDVKKWWYIPSALIPKAGKLARDILSCRVGAGTFSTPLAAILALILEKADHSSSSFNIGGDWSARFGWNPTDTVGTAFLKTLRLPWKEAALNGEIDDSFWTRLARQRAINMAFAYYRQHHAEPAFQDRLFTDNFQPDYKEAIIIDMLFRAEIGSLPLEPPDRQQASHNRLQIRKLGNSKSLDDQDYGATCGVHDQELNKDAILVFVLDGKRSGRTARGLQLHACLAYGQCTSATHQFPWVFDRCDIWRQFRGG
jgi:hypothetical protein